MRTVEKFSYFLAFFATIIRYYDYALFGLSASSIAANFMPNGSDSERLLNFFIIFGIAVAVRPLGSIIFGRISDKVGRVASVKITTIIASISVITIAFLPTYGTIGIVATIILTIARMLFIMSLAGEVDAIKIYVSEKIGKNHRHLAISIVSFSAQIGVLIAAFMYHFTLSFDEISWLWRINFITGGCFGLIIFFLRHNLQESNYYKKHIPTVLTNYSLVEILSQNRMKFLLATILSGGLGASYNFWIIFLSTFICNATSIISQSDAAQNNMILIVVYGAASLISGIITDRLNLTRSIYTQVIIALMLSLVTITLMCILSLYEIFLFPLHIIGVFLVPIYMIPIQIKLQSIFTTDSRVRMCSLSHSIGSMIFSATTPFFCMLLWKSSGSIASIYTYLMLITIIMFAAIIVIKNKDYVNLFEKD